MSATDTVSERWIRRFHPRQAARARLLCLPHAGGSASYFFPVSRAMPDSVEVLAVQYPGRQDRRTEPNVETIAELADQILDAVWQYTDLPLAIFGHSMGASAGFELARRLEARGTVPTALFASGRRSPGRHRVENMHKLDDDGLLAEVKRLSGTNAAVLDDDELVRMVLPSIRSDYRAAETYRPAPGPPLTCPVYALTGDTDPKVTLDEAQAWAEETTGEFDLKVFPGGHFYLVEHMAAILDILNGHFGAVSART